MTPWEERPTEIASLLNPAFCGEVIRRSISKYQDTVSKAMPLPLVFLVLPIVLHARTRIQIAPRQQMHTWLESHQDVKVGFAGRARQLRPFTTESLMLFIQQGIISVDEYGNLTANKSRDRIPINEEEVDIEDCFDKADVVGRWLARAGTIATIYTVWGVKP